MIFNTFFSHLVSEIELAKKNSAAMKYPELSAQKPLGMSITLTVKFRILAKKGSMPSARGIKLNKTLPLCMTILHYKIINKPNSKLK